MKRLLAAATLAAFVAGPAMATDTPQPQMTRQHVEVIATQGEAPGIPPEVVLFLLTVVTVCAVVCGGGSPPPLRIPVNIGPAN
jgi:opacity protein-like surface antigen